MEHATSHNSKINAICSKYLNANYEITIYFNNISIIWVVGKNFKKHKTKLRAMKNNINSFIA